MSTKIIEGQEYVLKSTMEQIIKDRVSKVAQRASHFETQVSDLSKQLEDSQRGQSNIDILTSKIEDLSQKLENSERKFSRYQSISKHGISDKDMIDAIEWSYDRAQKSLPKKDQSSLSDWLEGHVANPDQAPPLLRPHLKSLNNRTETALREPPTTQEQLSSLQESQTPQNGKERGLLQQPPKTNEGAIVAPESPDFMTRALKDPDFYAQNRDRVRKAWLNQNRRQ